MAAMLNAESPRITCKDNKVGFLSDMDLLFMCRAPIATKSVYRVSISAYRGDKR